MQRLEFDRLGRSAGGAPSLRGALARLHRDEQGDEGVNKILIIAMIVVPLVIVLIVFGNDIVKFFKVQYDKLTGTSKDKSPDLGYPGGTGAGGGTGGMVDPTGGMVDPNPDSGIPWSER